MQDIFAAYEGLHLFNEAMYKATLYLEAVGKSGGLEKEQMNQHRDSICQIRSATNLYLITVIREVEQRNARVGVGSFPQ